MHFFPTCARAMHSNLEGWQNLLGNFWIMNQIWIFWMLLDISTRLKTKVKPFLNDVLCVFKNLKHLKMVNVWWFLIEKCEFWREYGECTYATYCIFFHIPTVRKYESFIHFCLSEQFFHPLPMKLDHCAVVLCWLDFSDDSKFCAFLQPIFYW